MGSKSDRVIDGRRGLPKGPPTSRLTQRLEAHHAGGSDTNRVYIQQLTAKRIVRYHLQQGCNGEWVSCQDVEDEPPRGPGRYTRPADTPKGKPFALPRSK